MITIKLPRGEYCTVTEYAQSIGVSVQYIRKLLGQNKISGAIKVNNLWLIPVPKE